MIERTTLHLSQQKPIRSFVERQGRISAAHKGLIDQLWPQFSLPLGTEKLDYKHIFGRFAPLTLEIGFGDGRSLLNLAKNNPQQDFIGIEVYKAGIAKLLLGIHEHKLTNLRVFCADAIEVLQNCVADAALQQVLLFFPDPWPKVRHHKRRIVQPAFIQLIAQKLQTHGVLHMATDWEDYALHMLQVMQAESGWDNLAPNAQFIQRPDTRSLTKFEQRGQRLGYDIWDLMFRKNS